MMEKFGDLSLLKIKGVSRVGIFFGRRRIENKGFDHCVQMGERCSRFELGNLINRYLRIRLFFFLKEN